VLHPRVRTWRRRGTIVLAFVVVFLLVRGDVADLNRVSSASMAPALLTGDRVLVDLRCYGLRSPFGADHLFEWGTVRRGDVVVFAAPDDGARLVKRVAGLPGDRLEIRHGRLWLNGEAAEDAPGLGLPPTVVPPRHYFMMGDNRSGSLDSRAFGCVPRGDIAGRVRAVAVSLDPVGHRPRWQRWGQVVR
jgi:signal peptidase I